MLSLLHMIIFFSEKQAVQWQFDSLRHHSLHGKMHYKNLILVWNNMMLSKGWQYVWTITLRQLTSSLMTWGSAVAFFGELMLCWRSVMFKLSTATVILHVQQKLSYRAHDVFIMTTVYFSWVNTEKLVSSRFNQWSTYLRNR